MKETWDALTNEELCIEYQKTRDNILFEYFLSRNRGLIESYMGPIIRKYPEQKDELLQRGQIAMWEVMKRFDVSKETKFSTYLYYYFKNELQHYFHEQFMTHIPINLIQHLNEVKEKIPYAAIDTESLSQTLFSSESGSDVTLEELIPSDNPNPLDIVLDKDRSERIMKILDKLSPRESKCIQMYFGLNGYEPCTLEIIGKEYNVTRERIRQIIVKALRKIKYQLSNVKGGFKYEDWS